MNLQAEFLSGFLFILAMAILALVAVREILRKY